jgi:hypothetical protein
MYSCPPEFYYLQLLRHTVISLCIKRIQSNETVLDIDAFCTIKCYSRLARSPDGQETVWYVRFIHVQNTGFIHSQAFIVQDGPLASLFGVSAITRTLRHVVGLLWTSDQPVAEASTYTGQHNVETQETKIHAPNGIWTRDPNSQAPADLRLRSRGHWDRLQNTEYQQ